MAIETERPGADGSRISVSELATGWKPFVADLGSTISGYAAMAWRGLRSTGPYRFLSASLARRIFLSNLLGLAVLLGGMLWLSQHQAWLISARVESLKIQGEIIAAAIASNASLDTDRLAFEQDRLPEADGRRMLFREDGFAAMELSLRPDRVAPVLRRLILPAHNTRARIYTREGTLIIDSNEAIGAREDDSRPEGKVRVKTFWTRLAGWFDGSDLPVYREIGTANGTYYPEVRQALRGVTFPPMLLLTDEGKQIVSHAVPIQRRNAILGVLLLSTRPGEIDEILNKERWVTFAAAFMAFCATVMASLLLARTIAGPMSRLSAAAEQVSQSLTAPAELPDFSERRDEVGQMAGAFRKMTAALYRRIEASEKFAADVAHELKNPLAAARSTADVLGYAKTDTERQQLVEQLQGELRRLNRLITDVSNASRLDAELARQRTVLVDICIVLRGVVDVFRDMLASDGRRIVFDVADAPSGTYVVNAHEGRLGQVVTNLIDNALSFSPPDGVITVRVRRKGADVEFAIEDQGPGIPADRKEAIFERFYSDRPQSDQTRGKNSGLGLSISREIISACGGSIWAENRDTNDRSAGGARFTVSIPAAQANLRGVAGLGRRH
ncbi:MAG: stimulus-sensing domain-containing protein [Hyphomicrobiaceae bacterium]|jgi:two-component system sensor histidine kinase ChvG